VTQTVSALTSRRRMATDYGNNVAPDAPLYRSDVALMRRSRAV
jgi:hypothetical protein